MKKSILLVSVILGLLSFGGFACAASVEVMREVPVMNDFMVGPTFFELEANRGDVIKKTIQVDNRKGETWTFNVGVEDFQGSLNDPNQTVMLQGDTSGKYGAKEWVNVELNNFTTSHGDRQFFDVTITIPEDADAGDHYVSVLVSAPPKDEPLREAPNVRITSRTGVLFFIRVKGDVKEEGKLVSFEKDKTWYEKPNVILKTVFENSGSVRLRPSGNIEVKNMFGSVTGNIEVKPYNSLRNSVRAMRYDWGGNMFSFGKYTATITLNLGYGDMDNKASVSFWVIPWKSMIVLLVALIALIVVLRFLFSKFEINIKRKEVQ